MATRRVFLASLLTSCSRAQSGVQLRARPGKATTGSVKPGVNPLNLRRERDALLYVPGNAPDPAPLVLYLHGATGNEQQGIRRLSPLADEFVATRTAASISRASICSGSSASAATRAASAPGGAPRPS